MPSRALVPALSFLRQIFPGVILAGILAVLAKFLAEHFASGAAGAKLPLSPVLCAVLLGMFWRNTVGIPGWSLEGLNWTMRILLRTGIALVGVRLTLAGASTIAATAVPVVVCCIGVALLAGAGIARISAVPARLAALLAIGTAVCGCTAVIALSPVIRAKNVETAFAVACVVLFGCIAMLCYPWVAGWFFSASPLHAGVFLGTAIHDTSQVVGSALIYSQQASAPDALTAASLTKLLRNLSMAILIPAAAWWSQRHQADAAPAEESLPKARIVPFFVIAFILFIILRTAGDAIYMGSAAAPLWEGAIEVAHHASDLLLICSLAAVGLSVSFGQMWQVGWRPLAAGFSIALLVGACSLGLTLLLYRFS